MPQRGLRSLPPDWPVLPVKKGAWPAGLIRILQSESFRPSLRGPINRVVGSLSSSAGSEEVKKSRATEKQENVKKLKNLKNVKQENLKNLKQENLKNRRT
ncbi:hypothetical protein EYF80_067690 [Liparis tanakae]|uniref:Uncharacterized protein n=1 Tax=Liparis tanakae TaxID=230148 RepID=A0A4Z2E065_9TELE|nr:hypothetical protein EYF80_067690 [Liparis tanakae]